MGDLLDVGLIAIVGDPQLLQQGLSQLDLWPGRTLRGVHLHTWGLDRNLPAPDDPLLLTTVNRLDGRRVAPAEIARWLAVGDQMRLGAMQPPFAAIGIAGNALRLSTDCFGFRPLYRASGPGWEAVSTSALMLSRLRGAGLATSNVILQSQLGWQLGDRTIFSGVKALAPGESLLLDETGIRVEQAATEDLNRSPLTLADGVARAAMRLRTIVQGYLEDTLEPTIQLTGGQDSRIVLSAIPPSRRRSLRAMTLHTPGSSDARIAGQIAQKYGMEHTVRSIQGLDELTPQECYTRVLEAARLSDCGIDPLARAATLFAEESFEQGERLCGLGGEVARGFYYMGRVRPAATSRRRAETLARWRMLANEAVPLSTLSPDLREGALDTAVDAIHATLVAEGPEWFAATDGLYLHRMRRWAGVAETMVTFQRSLTNPMLDHQFVDMAQRLDPRDKAHSLFLARLQVALDDDLSDLPLDGRPTPRTYATSGIKGRWHVASTQAGKLARKVKQRVRDARRPPAGGTVLAGKLVEHFRRSPDDLDPARGLGIFDNAWIDALASGEADPTPASLALVSNLLAAAGAR